MAAAGSVPAAFLSTAKHFGIGYLCRRFTEIPAGARPRRTPPRGRVFFHENKNLTRSMSLLTPLGMNVVPLDGDQALGPLISCIVNVRVGGNCRHLLSRIRPELFPGLFPPKIK
jgi:hypothetical protein